MRAIGAVMPLAFIVACATAPATVKRDGIPVGAEIAVMSFRDCLIANQEDCLGSGSLVGSIVARALSAGGSFRAFPISRPVSASVALADDDAVSHAKRKGYLFVLTGEVDDFYAVAPMTFRRDRAGISMRLLRVQDGSVIAFFSERREVGNFSAPDRIVLQMAERFRIALLQP